MDSEQQKYYLDELFLQCQFALDAYSDVQRLSSLLSKQNKKQTAKDNRDLFRYLHSLFTHTGNVSKLLFNRREGKPRSEILRKIIGIPNTGHLLENRAFRNHLEHYDERLDDWINDWIKNNHPEYFYTMSLLGLEDEHTNEVVALGLEEMRVFNYLNMRFIFQNESFDLITLVEGIKELSNRLKELGADCQLKRYSINVSSPFED